MDKPFDLPPNITDWTKEHVRYWVTDCLQIEQDEADILYTQKVNGKALNVLSKEDFQNMKISYGPAAIIIHERTQMTKDRKQGPANPDRKGVDGRKDPTNKPTTNKNEKQKRADAATLNEDEPREISNVTEEQPCCSEVDVKCRKVTCTPYPFDSTHESKRYTQHHFLLPEAGTSNYIDPVHEYKEFTNTGKATEEDKKMKFCNEVFRFAAACMNARTNGTIHFGVRDKPHGEIIGVHIAERELYGMYLYQMINKYFEEKQFSIAKQCIRPPRFVDVLHQENTQSDLVVIEVDVVPEHAYCSSQIFHTYQYSCTDQKWMKNKDLCCFVRDGESSKDILANVKHKDADFKMFYSKMIERDEARKKAEDNQRRKQNKMLEQGNKLVSLITGNRDTMDNSYFKWYILVANKCHESHTKHMEFLHEIPWFAVLDFDPDSCTNGLCKVYREKRVANLHSPRQFQNMDNVTVEKLEEQKLCQQTSWIFCNGRKDLNSHEYKPLDNKMWHKEKASEIRRMISFLCRKDLMQPGKFLVVFLLLSTVEDQVDPMNEVFSAFYQELNGMTNILCICEKEQIFCGWRDLQSRIISEEEMDERCVYNLSIENVNGTLLKLKSNTRSSNRFLPSHGRSSIILQRKDEDLMTFLDILCINQCRDTEQEKNKTFREFIKAKEEHFYRGGKATCWNFYFSSEKYTGPFIKRDNYEKLRHLVKSSNSEKSSVKTITVYHHPGCGGTTIAMHVLWELRDTFRCATLKRKTDNFTDIAKEVIMLATHGSTNAVDHYPVLLLVDDFEEEENVFNLQSCIKATIAERSIRYEKPIVIILHCMRSQNPEESSKTYCTKSVALIHKLSEKEKRAFEIKLGEIEQSHEKPEDFYSFMIMKRNFDVTYLENVARNILKGLNNASKEAQLISILALLNKYVNDSTISVSMCEELLGITAKQTFWGPESIEEKLGGYFPLLLRTEVEEYGGYQGLRIIHPLIARQCVEELRITYGMQQSSIMLNMLKANVFYETMIGKDILAKNVQSMLVTRQRKEHGDETDTQFSPLIEEIEKGEGHKSVERVFKEGAIRFNQNPFILQALARYFYLREKDIDAAFQWAKKAKKMSPTNSFILDTLGQIYKTQLKMMIAKQSKMCLDAQGLKNLLEIAENASKAFKECQEQTEKAESESDEYESAKLKGSHVHNTVGYLGQIEVCLCTVDILFLLPWFNTKDGISRRHLRQFLSGKWDISVDNVSKSHEEICGVLQDSRHFLTKLKSHLKETFDFFDDYFVLFKQKSLTKETFECRIREIIDYYYKIYRRLFCTVEQLPDSTIVQKKSMPLLIQDYRLCLEFYKADKFSGILQYLNGHEQDVVKMESIVNLYKFLLEKSPDTCSQRDKQNFILANIVLHCISPKSDIAPIEKLKEYLREVLQTIGFDHKSSEPYFLASLLFWPQEKYQLDSDSKLIAKCISSMRKSSRGQYRHMHHAKYPKAQFYLANNKGLKRFVHKGKIDQSFSDLPPLHLNSLWQGGELWKEPETKGLLSRVQGRVEDDSIIVEYGSDERVTIPVRAAHLGELRSGKSIEQVSFYLGFSIGGPIAYDIEIMRK
ncbi:PREDICTED: sterile alpha motif domain-containing protein 9-like [Nanorana parkeri]|uniref:sterile alpha motif domain-containing protein 9-like n=1 Tax=Nanorana parkeri TaxID=125878 RepID=UPI0008546099|nr:PREDICTED: sterile alpha motif domain-containing protein 9-like [Nanorana parkeri]